MDAAAYAEMVALEDRHWWFIARRRIIRALIRTLPLPPKARILEIGCGSGGNFEMLAEFGQVYAGEYEPEVREVARARGVAEAVEPCELPDIFPFPDQKFDLIAMFDVLEHIEDDAATLEAVRDHLTPKGWLIITVPAFPFLWTEHDRKHRHFRRYTCATLDRALGAADLHLRYRSFFNFLLFPPIAAVRLAKKHLLAGHKAEAATDILLPPAPVNSLLTWMFGLERFAMGRAVLPFAVSLIVSAQAADSSS